jgi:two-component sensor histidine kinase
MPLGDQVSRRIARMVGQLRSQWYAAWRTGLRPRSLSALLFAAACVVAATMVRIGLGLISPDSAVFAPFYSATLVAALMGGAEAGTLAVLLGGISAYWFFVPPHWALPSFRLEQLVSLILYGTSSVVIIWAAQSYRRLLQRLRSEEETRQLLNLELIHRIKNNLAVVQAIVSQTLQNQDDLLEAVSGRLAALGATNELLVRSDWQGASLREILAQEFAPYAPARFRMRGEDVNCPNAVAVMLAMITHELTTNAVKYGALSSPRGQVSIVWNLSSGRLTIEWLESGGATPLQPTREGFGTKLLRSGVRQFNGSVDRRFEADGLRCRISLSMPDERAQNTARAGNPRVASKAASPSLAGMKHWEEVDLV